jgi:hypothetical protein
MLPEGVETLLIGAGSLVTPVPETGVIIMYPEAKAPRVYSVTIVVKSRILIEGRINDEVPLDAPEIGLGARITQTLPSEFKSIAGNVGDASNVVVSLLPSALSWSYRP